MNKENKKDERFPFKLSLEDARKMIFITGNYLINCFIRPNYVSLIAHSHTIINQKDYNQCRISCNEEEHKILDEIFGQDQKEWFPGELYWVKDNGEWILKYSLNIYGLFKSQDNFINNKVGKVYQYKKFIKADGVKLPEL